MFMIETVAATLLIIFGFNLGEHNERLARKHEIACNKICVETCARVEREKNEATKELSYYRCRENRFWKRGP